MLILDGCYLIDLFLKGPVEQQQDEDDPNFNLSCMREYLYHDLLLLENQLPWPVLEFFYDLIGWDYAKKALSEVVIDFFKPVMAGDRDTIILSNPKPDVEIHHILDLIRTALIQGEHQDKSPLSRTIISRLPQRIPSAVTLLEAGVKFKPAPQGCILNIKFKDGVFTIPVLTIDQKTGPLFMNLLAYEQCFHRCNYRITSYVILMRNIINTSKDVDLLCEKGIVANWLWSAEDACKLVNEVSMNTTINDYHYRILSNDVNEYQKSLWGQWMRVINFICIYRLKRDYFNTPRATISVFAAFVLLVLTFLQTIYTMLPSDRHPSPAPG